MAFSKPLIWCIGLAGMSTGAYYFMKSARASWATASPEQSDDCLKDFPAVARNAQARTLLMDLSLLIKSIDEEGFWALLRATDELCALYESCRSGDARAVIVAQALRLRRQIQRWLGSFVAEARRKRPIEASNAAEDLEAFHKWVEDVLHNITQEQSFQVLR